MPVRVNAKGPAEFVRDHLGAGTDYVGSCFKAYKLYLRQHGYRRNMPGRESFSRLFWQLRLLGAIQLVREEPIGTSPSALAWAGGGLLGVDGLNKPSPRRFYRVANAQHAAWRSPEKAYREARGLGLIIRRKEPKPPKPPKRERVIKPLEEGLRELREKRDAERKAAAPAPIAPEEPVPPPKVVAPPKRRGRPPKAKPIEVKAEEQVPKAKRGRPALRPVTTYAPGSPEALKMEEQRKAAAAAKAVPAAPGRMTFEPMSPLAAQPGPKSVSVLISHLTGLRTLPPNTPGLADEVAKVALGMRAWVDRLDTISEYLKKEADPEKADQLPKLQYMSDISLKAADALEGRDLAAAIYALDEMYPTPDILERQANEFLPEILLFMATPDSVVRDVRRRGAEEEPLRQVGRGEVLRKLEDLEERLRLHYDRVLDAIGMRSNAPNLRRLEKLAKALEDTEAALPEVVNALQAGDPERYRRALQALSQCCRW